MQRQGMSDWHDWTAYDVKQSSCDAPSFFCFGTLSFTMICWNFWEDWGRPQFILISLGTGFGARRFTSLHFR